VPNALRSELTTVCVVARLPELSSTITRSPASRPRSSSRTSTRGRRRRWCASRRRTAALRRGHRDAVGHLGRTRRTDDSPGRTRPAGPAGPVGCGPRVRGTGRDALAAPRRITSPARGHVDARRACRAPRRPRPAHAAHRAASR
jgi:hypothetical protein